MKPKMGTFMRVWKNGKGQVRLVWLLLFGTIAYAAVLYGVVGGMGWAFGKLFEAWGLTEANLSYAPGWAQYVVARHGDFAAALMYCLSTLFFLTAGKKLNGKTAPEKDLHGAFGALAGLGIGVLLTVLALIPDSVRLERPLGEPLLYPAQLIAFALLALGWINMEAVSKRFAFDCAKSRCGRWQAYAVGTAAGMLLSGNWSSWTGILNTVLLSLLTCVLYERGGLRASVGFGIARNAWCMLVFRFPGLTTSAEPVYSLYHVSDAWLTGGGNGPVGGLWMTVCCLGILIGLNFKGIVRVLKDKTRRRDTHG